MNLGVCPPSLTLVIGDHDTRGNSWAFGINFVCWHVSRVTFQCLCKAPRARCRRMAKKAMKTKAMKAAATATVATEAGALQFRTSRFRYVTGFQQVNVGGGINWIYIKVGTTPIEMWTGYHGKEYRCVVGGHHSTTEAGAPPAGWTLQPSVDIASATTAKIAMKSLKPRKAKKAMTMKSIKAVKSMKSLKPRMAKKAMKTKAMKTKAMKSLE